MLVLKAYKTPSRKHSILKNYEAFYWNERNYKINPVYHFQVRF